jgi:hypothetical protein
VLCLCLGEEYHIVGHAGIAPALPDLVHEVFTPFRVKVRGSGLVLFRGQNATMPVCEYGLQDVFTKCAVEFGRPGKIPESTVRPPTSVYQVYTLTSVGVEVGLEGDVGVASDVPVVSD